MTTPERIDQRIPQYYETMYKDGYNLWEICYSAKRTLMAEAQQQESKVVIDKKSYDKIEKTVDNLLDKLKS